MVVVSAVFRDPIAEVFGDNIQLELPLAPEVDPRELLWLLAVNPTFPLAAKHDVYGYLPELERAVVASLLKFLRTDAVSLLSGHATKCMAEMPKIMERITRGSTAPFDELSMLSRYFESAVVAAEAGNFAMGRATLAPVARQRRVMTELQGVLGTVQELNVSAND